MVALQALVLLGVAFGILMIAQTTFDNLDRLGVQSGIDFLWQRSGFDINQTLLPYSANSPLYMAFLVAMGNTLLLAAFVIVLATFMGLVVALLRLSGDWFLSGLGQAFIETSRNIPALLQIFFIYFIGLRSLPPARESYDLFGAVFINNRGVFLPEMVWVSPLAPWLALGLIVLAVVLWAVGRRRHSCRYFSARWAWAGWLVLLLIWLVTCVDWRSPTLGRFGYQSSFVISPELVALILGLSIYNASYIAEIIRAGFQAVPRGQWEAARSLSLGYGVIMRRIIVPQAMRVIVPPLTNSYLNVFKATSLGAAIGYPEIVSVLVGTTNNLVGRPVEIMCMTFVIYSLVSLAAAWAMHRLDRRYQNLYPA